MPALALLPGTTSAPSPRSPRVPIAALLALALFGFAATGLTAFSAAPSPSTRPGLSAGAAAIDITPTNLPVLVNGGMFSRSVARVKTLLHARAIALADGSNQVALVVADSCMMTRSLLDEAKALASRRTGIPSDRILISATHAHSAASSMACLGTDADPAYVPFLRDRLVDAIASAQAHLEPARIGFARADAAEFTALRQWIRRPDRIAEDPFGNLTVRANMHAGANWDDVTGEAGPEDPDLSLIAIQSRDGRPLAVLGNFSMHYFGDDDLSADYYGLFSEGLRQRIAPEPAPGHAPFVGVMSHGCSGDIWRRDYTQPAKWNPALKIEEYADGLLAIALKAYTNIQYRADADLAMVERRLTLKYRVPNRQRLEWAQRIVAATGSRMPTNTTEVYAREQILLHERPQTEVVVQALRVGDIAIGALPTETYALTGLKIKAASPLPRTLVIELANGGDGYIPPPELHLLGGYNTWPARSAGLEVEAEPRLAATAIDLLERVAGQSRRLPSPSEGPASRAVGYLRPAAWWRLDEFTGPHAVDATPHHRDAVYEPGVVFHLEGPRSDLFASNGEKNRAAHFVGGRLRARLPGVGDRYSVALWVWNGMPNEARGISGWFFSREWNDTLGDRGDHLGVGGTNGAPGRLVFQHGRDPATALTGRTVLPRWEWHPVVLVREPGRVRVYLDGRPEIDAPVAGATAPEIDAWFFGGRSDRESGWEGRLDEIAVFDRPLTPRDLTRLSTTTVASPDPR